MPTAARLVAALSLAALACLITPQLQPLLPDGTDFLKVTGVNSGLGIILGWWLVGTRTGCDFWGRVNNGVTGASALLLLGVLVQGAAKMTDHAYRRLFGDPFEALASILLFALDYFLVIAVPHVLMTVLLGGVLCGLLTEFAARRWR